jgi:hypothetical protein
VTRVAAPRAAAGRLRCCLSRHRSAAPGEQAWLQTASHTPCAPSRTGCRRAMVT